MVGDDVSDVGFGVEFGVGPNFASNLDATVEFVEGVEVADGDVSGHDCCPIYVSSFWIWVKSGEESEIGKWRKVMVPWCGGEEGW